MDKDRDENVGEISPINIYVTENKTSDAEIIYWVVGSVSVIALTLFYLFRR